MKKVTVPELLVDCALSGYLCHTSGEILHTPGEIITRTHRALLHECEIDEIILIDADEDPSRIKKELQTKRVALESIPIGEPVPVTLLDGAGQPVVNEGEIFSASKFVELSTADKGELIYRKDPMELQFAQLLNYRMLLDSDKMESLELVADPDEIIASPVAEQADATDIAHEEPIPEERFMHHPSKQISLAQCKQLMEQPTALTVAVSAPPAGAYPPVRIIAERSRDTTAAFKRRYLKWVADLDPVFSQLKANRETRFEDIEAIARDIVQCFFEDCFYCCNLMNLRHPPTSEKYLLTHAINVAIGCGGAGALFGYPMPLVRELTAGALLHDIGHAFTFRPLFSEKKLGAEEQQKYIQHATVGMAMLKNITKVPITNMLMVVQHHEWLDGSGRIFHAVPSQLHDFSRLLMIVDFFESSCRFCTPSAALAATISAVQAGKLDVRFLKTLLTLLSVFPIGASLKTADGTICKVIGTHSSDVKKPLLRSIYTIHEDHLFPIDKQELVDMKKTAVNIVGEVSHSALASDVSVGFRSIG